MRLVVHGAEVYAYTGARAWDSALPTAVFLHGAAHDHGVWALQSRYVAHHRWNVLAVDLPGHGKSAGAPLGTVEGLARWIVGVLDAAKTGEAALIGHSMGALAALECAATFPQRVTRIALVGPAVPMQVSEDLMHAAREDAALAYGLINGWSFGTRGQLGGNQWPGVWMSGNALRLLERSGDGVLAIDLAACERYRNGLDAAARVRCPALVVLGGRDVMAPPRDARALIDALGDKDVLVLEHAGHAIMAEEPDALLDALRRFLPA